MAQWNGSQGSRSDGVLESLSTPGNLPQNAGGKDAAGALPRYHFGDIWGALGSSGEERALPEEGRSTPSPPVRSGPVRIFARDREESLHFDKKWPTPDASWRDLAAVRPFLIEVQAFLPNTREYSDRAGPDRTGPEGWACSFLLRGGRAAPQSSPKLPKCPQSDTEVTPRRHLCLLHSGGGCRACSGIQGHHRNENLGSRSIGLSNVSIPCGSAPERSFRRPCPGCYLGITFAYF